MSSRIYGKQTSHAERLFRAAQWRLLCSNHRVSLDSVVYAYLRGESPEGIAESFPALSLDQIFGALAYYEANRADVDRYLSAGRQEFDALRLQWRRSPPELYQRLVAARQRTQAPEA